MGTDDTDESDEMLEPGSSSRQSTSSKRDSRENQRLSRNSFRQTVIPEDVGSFFPMRAEPSAPSRSADIEHLGHRIETHLENIARDVGAIPLLLPVCMKGQTLRE